MLSHHFSFKYNTTGTLSSLSELKYLTPKIRLYINNKEVQNRRNSENIHLVSLILKKNKKTTESVIFHLYSKDITNVFGISPTLLLEYQEYKMSVFGICFISSTIRFRTIDKKEMAKNREKIEFCNIRYIFLQSLHQHYNRI